MAGRGQGRKRARGRVGGPTRLEWVGGRLSPPFYIRDREEPYRAELALWMELPSGLVVGQQAIDSRESAGAVARVLRAALERPAAGPPRRPDAIRVGDASLAAEVRDAIGDGIPILVAPTPELDQLLDFMLETLPDESGEESYLEGGHIPAHAVESLFGAMELLYRMAPWKVASDGQVLRMDIPGLGIDGACVSIIGRLGQSRGIMIFPDFAGYEAFLRVAEAPRSRGPHIDFGTNWLMLGFERAEDLPASMRREAEVHGWRVADADAYPRVERRDSDGAPRPLVERDLKIATACATSLTTFFIKHRALFEAEEFEPVCESYFDEHDLEVRFTYPYGALALFDVDEAPPPWAQPSAEPRRAKVGRNDPCPCGSGRKYKKCHLAADEDERERTARPGGDARHDLDRRMVRELARFAERRFGPEWRRFERNFVDASEAVALAIPWAVYEYRVRGATVLERYLEERGRGLTREERAWLGAQQTAWLSVWEVTEVDPGVSLTLHDLLSGEVRRVREVSGSQTLVARDALLARVVVQDGVALLCGSHPRPLPPPDAAEVVRRARARLRRRRAVPVEKLRDAAFGGYLIRRWEEAVAQLDARIAMPLDLRNTDGDPVLLTIDHFEIAPHARSLVESRLAALDDVERSDEEEGVYTFARPANPRHASWETTLIGRACFSGTTLRLETNSRERADALRKRVEAVCGKEIRHRAREHADPQSSRAPQVGGEPEPDPPPEVQEALREYKRRHYADWPDHALPALNGKTPREAVRTASGRAAVDVLLKDMENHERRFSGGASFDFAELRRALRLE